MTTAKKKGANVPRAFRRKSFRPRAGTMHAYDLETTNIAAGNPSPLYVTAYGLDGDFKVAEKLTDSESLLEVLALQFLTPAHDGHRFVAWNANNFDVYLVARALLLDDRYLMRPYMTRSKSLRGMRVIDQVTECEWEFLDGMAMTGCMMKLELFLDKFAPDLPKMTGVINFEAGEQFDNTKQSHVEYAMRDSVGLYYALINAQMIVRNTFGEVLRPTVGNMGIRIFQSLLPKEVAVQPLRLEVDKIMREYVMRGGYCYCAKRYTGPVWKYDINQAYAAAMREAWLPDGNAQPVRQFWARYPGVYRLQAKHSTNKIPFYYTDIDGDRIFGMCDIAETWLTSIEVEQLISEGWAIKISEGYLFDGRFKMTDYVDKLEHIRMNADGGPNGAVGTMMKSIGNNSYGKTVEQLDGVEYVISNECPEEYSPFVVSDDEHEDLPVWVKKGEPQIKEYHKPQIGSFITAHVRMKVRRAALLDADAWLYADTDCVVFSREPAGLDIHKSLYGAWKVECEGEHYRIITKKVYAKVERHKQCENCVFYTNKKCSKKIKLLKGHLFCSQYGGKEKHAKGMNVKRLTDKEMIDWSRGNSPSQKQIHKNNLMKVLAGADMFIERVRRGTKIKLDR